MGIGGVKGGPKTPGSGRKKGTPNRFTQNLMGICEEKGLDVFESLVEIALDKDPENKDRFPALKELAQYLYPKRKALEHSGEISNPYLHLPKQELVKLAEQEIQKLHD